MCQKWEQTEGFAFNTKEGAKPSFRRYTSRKPSQRGTRRFPMLHKQDAHQERHKPFCAFIRVESLPRGAQDVHDIYANRKSSERGTSRFPNIYASRSLSRGVQADLLIAIQIDSPPRGVHAIL